MGISWGRQPECALQCDLPRRRRQKVAAPDDLRRALFGVVDDNRQLIGIGSVGALDDEVACLTRHVLLDASMDEVIEADHLIGRTKANGARRFAARQSVAARSGINRLRAEGRRWRALNVGARTRALVGQT